MKLENYPVRKLEQQILKEDNKRARIRIQILIYIRKGYNHRDIASMMNVSVGGVSLWRQRFKREGFAGLFDKTGRGRKVKLQKNQIKQLGKAIDRGIDLPDGYRRGYKTKDVKQYIKEQFGVNYTNQHCGYILRKNRFRLKVPRPRNKSRNQEDIDEFKRSFKKNSLVWTRG